jgi:hypothetical protein
MFALFELRGEERREREPWKGALFLFLIGVERSFVSRGKQSFLSPPTFFA